MTVPYALPADQRSDARCSVCRRTGEGEASGKNIRSGMAHCGLCGGKYHIVGSVHCDDLERLTGASGLSCVPVLQDGKFLGNVAPQSPNSMSCMAVHLKYRCKRRRRLLEKIEALASPDEILYSSQMAEDDMVWT